MNEYYMVGPTEKDQSLCQVGNHRRCNCQIVHGYVREHQQLVWCGGAGLFAMMMERLVIDVRWEIVEMVVSCVL